MNTKETLKKMEEITELYVRELDRYDMEQLTRKPSEDEWSLGQMYMHLIRAALFMQLRHVDTF
ncbi:DinB family protein, partial [Rhodococcus rhodochrous]|uniref:DinB family protein n=2 Tax=Bacillati TaxID=1783272 RepID=UPI0018E1C2B1